MGRIAALAALCAAAAAGCGGGGERPNRDRPPAPVTLTAAIHDDFVQVSPSRIGAGQITLVVSNQSGRAQTVTFETDELGGATGGRRARSPQIADHGTGRVTLDAREGRYRVRVGDRAVRSARVTVGPRRASAQDDLLTP